MTLLNQIYKCPICGNIVEVVHSANGNLVCCGQEMQLQEEKTSHQEFSLEKHVPIIEKTENGIKIKIGSIAHPMEESHYIEFIEILTSDNKIGRKYLKPGENPEVEFNTNSEILEVREYCNLHGLWVNKIKQL